jgi:hypothetical protein
MWVVNNKLRRNALCTLGVIILSVGAVSHADTVDDPYRSSNRNPFVQVFGLPATLSANINSAGNFSGAVNLDASNSFSANTDGGETILLDGETYRVNLHGRYGLFDNLEVGMDVPYIRHNGGSSDSFIEDWHDFWGFPDGDRPDYPQDQLNYHYKSNGQTQVSVSDFDNNNQGLGDVSLSFGYQLSANASSAWALRGGVKFGTGEAGSLLGSGGNDAYLGLNFSHSASAVVLHANGGILLLGSSDVLDDIREDWVAYGSGAISWPVSNRISLKAQLDVHTAFYDSELTELGSSSAQLLLGGSIRLSEKMFLDLSVSEDIAVDTAPDVVFQIALRVGQW